MHIISEKSTLICSLLTSLSLLFMGSLQGDEFTTHISSAELEREKNRPIPWLTGPLLAPSGHVLPLGHWNIEPYEFITTNFGRYDHEWHTHPVLHNFYNANTQVSTQYGFARRFDITVTPQFSWNHTHGASHWDLNDLPISLSYQLVYDTVVNWWPAVKLSFHTSAPIGRYQKLDPNDKGTDVGGSGSWLPGVRLTMSQQYWWGGNVFFAPRLSFDYTIPTAVHVKGFNAYGGGHHTHGKVIPGQAFSGVFGFEISVTKRWVLAGDLLYVHANTTRFKGHRGATAGVPNTIGAPSIDQWSVAPAIEYNWNSSIGMIAGVWFSIAARNSPEFATAVVALNIYK